MEVVKVSCPVGGGVAAAGSGKEFGGGVGGDTASGKNKLTDRSRLGGDDGCVRACAIDGEAFLNLRHRLLCRHFGEAGGGVLAGEIARGDLLDAGGGEEGNGDGGEQCRDEESEDEGGARGRSRMAEG